MYQLDLSDPRLALPVAIYESPSGPAGPLAWSRRPRPADERTTAPRPRRLLRARPAGDRDCCRSTSNTTPRTVRSLLRRLADRPADGTAESRPLFFILPADVKDYTAATVPLYEYRDEGGAARSIPSMRRARTARSRSDARVLGRVWRNPARSRLVVNPVDATSPLTGSEHRRASLPRLMVRKNDEWTRLDRRTDNARSDRDDSDDADPARRTGIGRTASETSWLGEIVDQLESDPQECWLALESLAIARARIASVDHRRAVEPDRSAGARTLLRLLSSARDLAMRHSGPAALASDRRQAAAATSGLEVPWRR